MPTRKFPLVSGQFYHVFNRGVDQRPTYRGFSDYHRFLKTINFYRFSSPQIKLSYFLRQSKKIRVDFLNKLTLSKKFLVEIFAFCFMPNHFHFLIQQIANNGLSNFLRLCQNSYTKYFNTKNHRSGALFQGQFKAVRLETEEQFIHLSRYIHLNPYTSYVVKSLDQLFSYPWSSLPEYLSIDVKRKVDELNIVDKSIILNQFKSIDNYKKFIRNQAKYQRELNKIKHLTFD